MRKLTSILAALAVLATCNVQPAAATTVPMVVTVNGNGTLTGSGITGTVVPHGTTATMTLNVPALTAAAVTGTFSGTCNSTTVLQGNGACGTPSVTSTQVISSFSGSCNTNTYLSGGGSCQSAPLYAVVTTAETKSTSGVSTDSYLTFSGVTAGNYALECVISTNGNSTASFVFQVADSQTLNAGTWMLQGVTLSNTAFQSANSAGVTNTLFQYNGGATWHVSAIFQGTSTGTISVLWGSSINGQGVEFLPGSFCRLSAT